VLLKKAGFGGINDEYMMDEYLKCLFKQFCEAKGLNISNYYGMYSTNFVDWIENNRSLLNEYIDYLHYLGFDYASDDVVEVGKGKYDSLSNHGICVVSDFAETIGILNSRLFIDNGTTFVLRNDSNIIIPSQHILLTHNPYFEDDVLDWYLIHNNGDKNISIGMFGYIDDEDATKKIKVLEQISKQMTDDYSLNYDTCDGKYLCSLNSKRYIKKYVKILNR